MEKDNNKNIRQAILDASVDLFQAKGYTNTSMDEIAEAVGLTKGGLYHYVEKKGDLLKDIHDQILNAFLGRVEEAMKKEESPEKKLERWVEAHATVMHDYLGHLKVFFTEIDNYTEEMLNATVQKREQVRNMLMALLESGISEGKIRKDINPKIMGFLIFGMINWLYVWYRPNGPLGFDEILFNMKKIVTCGLWTDSAVDKGEDSHEGSAGDDARHVQNNESDQKV